MASALARVEDECRDLVRSLNVDPSRDAASVRKIVEDVVAAYLDRSISLTLPPLGDAATAIRRVIDNIAGYGPLQPFLDDRSVEEIWINEPGRVFIARRGRSELTTLVLSEAQVADLVERMLRPSGRRIDLSSPFVDAMLPDGSRLHVVIPQITKRHMAVNIRKFVIARASLDELISLGSLPEPAARFLEYSVAAGLNILVSGGTQAGKTTMVN